ncbi:MAG: winged helix-turn-helix domain-containing protein [Pantoea sp.]|uniref:winged helix-turn-helix domain-containing protein n=1 Tax=Pantoea sp. TaxID=69393 RepID=UPI0039E42BE8
MLYRINDEICFSTEDGLLTHSNRTDMIKLSIPAARLLDVLIKRREEVCTREYLLSEVWDRYGLTGSDNNLYQYISMLRRSLAGLGCSNAILTVPKTGFRLNPEVTCEDITEASVSTLSHEGATDALPHPGRNGVVSAPGFFSLLFSFLSRQYVYIIVFIFSLSAVFFYFTHYTPSETDPVSVQLPEGCTVTYLQDIDGDDMKELNTDIRRFMNGHGLLCNKNRTVVFDNYRSEAEKEYGRTLLAYCQSGAGGKFTRCDNYYFYNWEGRE